jgi:protein-disulfide isomerase
MSKKSTDSRAERTAALMKEQQRKERVRQLTIIGAIMVLLAVVVGVGIFLQLGRDKTSNSTVGASEFGLVIGPDDAPTEVVIYEDFLCPACGYFESATSEQLAEAAAAGDARVEYRAFYFLQNPDFEEYSLRAANAFRAVWEQVGDEAAMEFHNALFSDQPSESGPFPDDDWFVEKAVAAGADEAEIRPAIEDMEFQGWVEDATADASGVRSTPTAYVDGELVEAGNLDEMAEIVLNAIG